MKSNIKQVTTTSRLGELLSRVTYLRAVSLIIGRTGLRMVGPRTGMDWSATHFQSEQDESNISSDE